MRAVKETSPTHLGSGAWGKQLPSPGHRPRQAGTKSHLFLTRAPLRASSFYLLLQLCKSQHALFLAPSKMAHGLLCSWDRYPCAWAAECSILPPSALTGNIRSLDIKRCFFWLESSCSKGESSTIPGTGLLAG